MKLKSTLFMLLGLTTLWANAVTANPPQTVESVDVSRYSGKWYEIAKIPNRFQSHCVRNTSAEYTLMADNTIQVINRCEVQSGEMDQATGVARIVDSTTNAKLEVSFVNFLGLQLFWGDYWILYLDDDYQSVLVGTPDRKYGWVLARTKTLNPNQWQAIEQSMQSQGYERDRFEISQQ
jgi:apolipoprotein D and lipocalin family protein